MRVVGRVTVLEVFRWLVILACELSSGGEGFGWQIFIFSGIWNFVVPVAFSWLRYGVFFLWLVKRGFTDNLFAGILVTLFVPGFSELLEHCILRISPVRVLQWFCQVISFMAAAFTGWLLRSVVAWTEEDAGESLIADMFYLLRLKAFWLWLGDYYTPFHSSTSCMTLCWLPNLQVLVCLITPMLQIVALC